MRKKELIIMVLIIALTVFLAFLPKILNNREEEPIKTEETPTTITITIKGEIKVDELKIKIPYGYTYGYVITKIDNYLNKYSIISEDRKTRYYKDTTIIIESSDKKNNNTETNIDSGKININSASVDELVTLYGIGEKRAKAIIEYREKKKIETFQELKELLGVSDEVIRNIKEKAVL